VAKFHPKRPAYLCGKVIFEFYNNEDEDFKNRILKSLTKELRKEFNVSVTISEENLVENPERGTLVFSLTSVTLVQGKAIFEKILAYLDQHSPGRIIDDFCLAEEFP